MLSKEIWGNITWYLFHTLSYKLKYDNEKNVKELFNIFKTICNNLPCIICKEHANRYLLRVNENNIKTKQNLINVMFIFHNEVNKITNNNLFTIEEHNIKYSKANINKIVKKFINIWSYKGNLGYQGLKQNNYSKQLCINNFKKYISNNSHIFI